MMKYTKSTKDIADFFSIAIPTAIKLIEQIPDEMKVSLRLNNGRCCYRCRDDVFEYIIENFKGKVKNVNQKA